jgi:pimeloyl-ACP methyl ester carboxylesterase
MNLLTSLYSIRTLGIISASLLLGFTSSIRASELTFTEVLGANDVPLNVIEAGSEDGIEVLFIHGVSQTYLSWKNQLESKELQALRMVAFDLRGHGNSAKPWQKEDYHNGKIWADDVAAVITAKKLRAPLVVAWSYAGAVIMDYVRHHGIKQIAAINMVSNTAALVDRVTSSNPDNDAILQEMMAKQAFLRSANIEENIEYLKFATPLLTSRNLGEAWTEQAMLTGIMTPSYVRRALIGRKIDNKDLVNAVSNLPILLTYGSEDGSVTDPMANSLDSVLQNMQVSRYENVGHSPFLESPNKFNRELLEFVAGVNQSR